MSNSEAAPVSQLAQYIKQHGNEITVRGKTFTFTDLRHEEGLGFFATAKTTRSELLGMNTNGKVIGRPGAEMWEVLRMSGRGGVVAKFAIFEGKMLDIV